MTYFQMFYHWTLTKFCDLKMFTKTIFYWFSQLWATFATNLMKRPTIFLHNLIVPFHFYMLTKLCDQHLFFKKMAPVSIYQQNPAYFSNFEHNFRPIHKKSFNFCYLVFLFVSISTLWPNFIKITFLQQKWQRFQSS